MHLERLQATNLVVAAMLPMVLLLCLFGAHSSAVRCADTIRVLAGTDGDEVVLLAVLVCHTPSAVFFCDAQLFTHIMYVWADKSFSRAPTHDNSGTDTPVRTHFQQGTRANDTT